MFLPRMKFFATGAVFKTCILGISASIGFSTTAMAAPLSLEIPVKCEIGIECFLQQMPDMDLSEAVIDPKCGSASYDGHKGTDIRLLSLEDVKRNVLVIAAADGIVKGLGDGEKDQLVLTAADRRAIENRECGNGVVIDHGNGIETQYCHMKMGSIAVKNGQPVKAGDPLGFVDASGWAQFPHLHMSVRQDGNTIDPFTGRSLGEECSTDISGSWWEDKNFSKSTGDAEILKTGLAGTPINHAELVLSGGPANASVSDSAIVGCVWYANLRKDDQIYMSLIGPNGLAVKDTTKPLDRNKASWSGFIGKKRVPDKGDYAFEIKVLRDQNVLKSQNSKFTIE
jgi:murein DD-endopeptidase MepM/ murein hydrolase activator NlpD